MIDAAIALPFNKKILSLITVFKSTCVLNFRCVAVNYRQLLFTMLILNQYDPFSSCVHHAREIAWSRLCYSSRVAGSCSCPKIVFVIFSVTTWRIKCESILWHRWQTELSKETCCNFLNHQWIAKTKRQTSLKLDAKNPILPLRFKTMCRFSLTDIHAHAIISHNILRRVVFSRVMW